MRGKLFLKTKCPIKTRITPACAGKTRSSDRKRATTTDHPRVCGENRAYCAGYASASGSPPRVRGKRLYLTKIVTERRITPACAGKTSPTYALKLLMTDHPRVCGENMRHCRFIQRIDGSPPRVRGKPLSISLRSTGARITPACAGKTSLKPISSTRTADHPRVCGENMRVVLTTVALRGSPPRVRGKHSVKKFFHSELRITPACAGKTPSCVRRSCGAVRITPACAGKTIKESGGDMPAADHPRVCGENTSEMAYFRG